jgi:hypothetical protein
MVPADALDQVQRQIEHLARLLEVQVAGAGNEADAAYAEPGPYVRRKFFTPEELMERWGWGKTKVYEIPEHELPFWKRGQLKRYFWAHVWAYEGRITREQADEIYAVKGFEKGLNETRILKLEARQSV